MKKIIVAACLALSFAMPSVHAQNVAQVDPDSAAAVKDLLSAMNYRDTVMQVIGQMRKNMPAIMLQGASAAINANKSLSDAQKADAIAKAGREIPRASEALSAVFDDPALMDELAAEMMPIYTRHFTAAEIRQMAAFYRTPVGTKMIAAMPQIAGESMQLSQKIFLPRISAAIEKIAKPQ